ncbi:MAG TPA: Dyp-type peroxidase [Kofleriaceae bacterium]
MTEPLETTEIQGLVLRGYGKLNAARFMLLAVEHREEARRYLTGAIARVTPASESPRDFALQIAFTKLGLEALEVPATVVKTFSREFLEGMTDPTRSTTLGDTDANDPKDWRWGRADVHVMVMVYAVDETSLQTFVDDELSLLVPGFRVVLHQHSAQLPENREHFGWIDGLSMPAIDGVPHHEHRRERPPKPQWTGPLQPGEFLLGYPNEYKVYSESPVADPGDDPHNYLPRAADGRKDLGRNGTYLVYRQYTQNVRALWDYLKTNTPDPDAAIALGAKLVGRWPNGAPLVVSPHADDPAKKHDNEFVYVTDKTKTPPFDEIGLACPIGSHIRRANPRNDLSADRQGPYAETMIRKHQMIRRGRPYGKPLAAAMTAHALMAAPEDGEERGLHFICLVGAINRQFELVQRSWLQSANFHGLFKDGDPITATRKTGDNANTDFTVPAEPVRCKYKDMPAFTRLVGGAYFFLPSIAALKFIAQAPASLSSATDSESSASPSMHPPPR